MKAEVYFLCDRKKCEKCSYPICKHTEDINHAIDKESRIFEAIGFLKKDNDPVLILFQTSANNKAPE